MDNFLISFSLKDNGAEYTITLRGSGFEYEEIPITINEYNSFMDFKNREFPLEQNRRLYACDILQKNSLTYQKGLKVIFARRLVTYLSVMPYWRM